MPTVTAAVSALARHCGFSRPRITAMVHTLQAAGLLELGKPGHAPPISEDGFVSLFLAAAADRTHREAPAVAREWGSCSPGGIANSDDSPCLPTARSELLTLLDLAQCDDIAELRRAIIEVVCTWPEVAIHWQDGAVDRLQKPGSLPGRWQTGVHRKCTQIPGSAFIEAVRTTFGAN